MIGKEGDSALEVNLRSGKISRRWHLSRDLKGEPALKQQPGGGGVSAESDNLAKSLSCQMAYLGKQEGVQWLAQAVM